MIVFPAIDPIAWSIGPLKVHWYGLMYLLAFALAYGLAHYRTWRYHLDFSKEAISDIIFYSALGVIIGGRLGYMIFYNTDALLDNPLSLFKVWEGGMSFHGGLLGVAIALWFVTRKTGKTFLQIADFVAPLVPFGLAAGRLGNFINGELWGRVTTVPWAMVFPNAGELPRHPSQLYEFVLEGFVLGIIVWWYGAKPRPQGCVSGVFLIMYGLCRFFVEFFREPDPQLGFIAFNTLTMGQLLSIPMVLIGLCLWWRQRCKPI